MHSGIPETPLVVWLASAPGVVLPVSLYTSKLNALPRIGFGRWFWKTLPVAAAYGIVVGSWDHNSRGLTILPMAFHAQWALLIPLYRFFVHYEGHEPREVFLRSSREVPDSGADRIYTIVALFFMVACVVLFGFFANLLSKSTIWS